jgi:uncharacterized protein YkwD
MAKRHLAVAVLAATLAAVAIFSLSTIVATQEAKADLVTVRTCGGDKIKLNGAEKRTLELHNRARAKRGLKALCVNVALTKAAHAHSKEMIEKDYFSHNSFNGETVGQRLKRFGYTYSGYSYYLIGENIGSRCGSRHTPYDMFKWWMSSSDHRASILNKDFRQVGIGIHRGTFKSCTRATMYTVDFGARRR